MLDYHKSYYFVELKVGDVAHIHLRNSSFRLRASFLPESGERALLNYTCNTRFRRHSTNRPYKDARKPITKLQVWFKSKHYIASGLAKRNSCLSKLSW